MKNLRIAHQLSLVIGALILTFAAAAFFQIKTTSRSIYAERYDMLRTQTETALSVLQRFHALEAKGVLSKEEAQDQAFSVINDLRFTPDGYFFGYDYAGNRLIYPDKKGVGKNFADLADKSGKKFLMKIIDTARAGGGWTEFDFTKPGQPEDMLFPKAAYGTTFAPWEIVIGTGTYLDDLESHISDALWFSIAICVAVAIAGMLVAALVVRGITRPLANIHQVLQAVADDDTNIRIPHTDMPNEVGMMAKATLALQQKIRERHALTERQAQQEATIDFERRQSQESQRAETELQEHVVSTIGALLADLASGDLTVRCADLGPRYVRLRNNFNEALSQLEAAMAEVAAKGIDISGSKDEIRRASTDLSQRTERQAANLEEASAALDELTVAVRQTANGAQEAAKRVTSVWDEASRSDAIVAQAIGAMSGIERSSSEISKIIGVIDEIAFQTNLLALNAGVEAARAGESGKGFAVVAQEVRELAQRSAAAAKEIKEQISRASAQVGSGVQLVGDAGEALKRISQQIAVANEIVAKIAHSAQEQDTTLRAISSSVNQLDAATQHNAAMAEETTAVAEALASDTDLLLSLIRGFRVSSAGVWRQGENRLPVRLVS
jgi:methyl-accepting chemotaxis protein